MILFETTESVIEVLWDLALAVFAFRIGFVYLILNLASALLIFFFFALVPAAALADVFVSYPLLAVLSLNGDAPAALVPLLLFSAALWARVLVVHYEIPRAGGFRLAIGAVTLVLMAMVEAVVAWVGWEEGWWKGTGSWDGRTWAVLAGMLGWVALMPFGQMVLFERRGTTTEVVQEKEKRPVEETAAEKK